MNEIQNKERKEKIYERLEAFLSESKYLSNNKEVLFWIKRILIFIKNELPLTFKYQNFINVLKYQIDQIGKGIYTSFDIKNNCCQIIIDLTYTTKHDSFNECIIKFHPKVEEVSLELLNNGHYSEAIFEAVKALNHYVKDKANITGDDLFNAMGKAFKVDNPIIKLNKLVSQSDKDEQDGFRFLFQGAMRAIRNPKAHDTHKLKDRNKAIEYLAFLSLLFRKTDEGKL